MLLHEDIVEIVSDKLLYLVDIDKVFDDNYILSVYNQNVKNILKIQLNEHLQLELINENKKIIEYYKYDIFNAIQLVKKNTNIDDKELLELPEEKFYIELAYNIIFEQENKYEFIINRYNELIEESRHLLQVIMEEMEDK